MACFSPVPAWPDLVTGEWVFTWSPKRELGAQLDTPCRQCTGCRLARAAEWALRIMHEAHFEPVSEFVTLTFDDAFFPRSQSDFEREVSLFIKRLRKATGRRIKTFGCLELGETTRRPHAHLIVLGRSSVRGAPVGCGAGGSVCFEAPELSAMWRLGHVSVGDVTRESAGYVSRYVMKKRSVRDGAGEFELVPHPVDGEFIAFRPARVFGRSQGLGRRWFDAYGRQAVELGAVILRGGVRVPVPDYYAKLAKRELPVGVGADAQCAALEFAAATAWDRTPERLAVRAEVLEASIRTLSRGGL